MNQTSLYKSIFKKLIAITIVSANTYVSAAITLDRTRIIFNGDQKSTTITIYNKNKDLPYLAQAWLENTQNQKNNLPFVVVPPIQRVEPNQASQVRIEALPSLAQLPQDRESVYYFNLREVPPKSDKANVLQIALQSRIKLFYRPSNLMMTSNEMINKPWQAELVLIKKGNKLFAKNPTAYYTTIIGVKNSKNQPIDNFQAEMISPFSEQEFPVNFNILGNNPTLTYVNDYGGKEALKYTCNANECSVKK